MPSHSSAAKKPAISAADHRHLQLVWESLPQAPRGVALILHLMEANAARHEALEAGQIDLAAGIMADSLRTDDLFASVYGLPGGAIQELFQRASEFYAAHPTPVAEDEAIDGVLVQAWYRLGYVDGLDGVPQSPLAETPAPGTHSGAVSLQTDEEVALAEGVLARVQERFDPAYENGYRYGQAERRLKRDHAHLMDAVDEYAKSLLAAPDRIEDALALLQAGFPGDKVLESIREFPQAVQDEAIVYAGGRWVSIRERLAGRGVSQRLGQALPLTPLTLATLARVLAREIHLIDGEEDVLRSLAWGAQPYVDQLRRTLLMLSTFGVSAEAVHSLLDVRASAPGAEDVICDELRDLQRAARVRQVANALSRPVPEGRIWPLFDEPKRRGGADRPAKRPTLRAILDPEERASWAVRLARPGRDERDEAEIVENAVLLSRLTALSLADREADEALTGGAEILAAELCQRFDAEEPLSQGDVESYLGVEEELSRETPAMGAEAMSRAIARHVAPLAALALLHALDADTHRQARAEAALVAEGGEAEVLQAERWVRAYIEEATHLTGEDATLLRLRARALEGALDARADAEASGWLLDSAPEVDIELPADSLHRELVRAAHRAEADVRGWVAENADAIGDFAPRLLRSVRRCALRWAYAEASIAADIYAPIISPERPDVA